MNVIIVAVAKNLVIGKRNQLPWSLPADLKRFKALTMGKTMIMGRKTFESLPGTLPGRKHIVITNSGFQGPLGVETRSDLKSLLIKNKSTPEEVFVIGGASIYGEALPYCSKIYMTYILQNVEGDITFPIIDESQYVLTEESEIFKDEKAGLCFQYKTFVRRI